MFADLLLLYVSFVAEDKNGDVFNCELLYLFHPDLDGVERALISNTVN